MKRYKIFEPGYTTLRADAVPNGDWLLRSELVAELLPVLKGLQATIEGLANAGVVQIIEPRLPAFITNLEAP